MLEKTDFAVKQLPAPKPENRDRWSRHEEYAGTIPISNLMTLSASVIEMEPQHIGDIRNELKRRMRASLWHRVYGDLHHEAIKLLHDFLHEIRPTGYDVHQFHSRTEAFLKKLSNPF